MSLRANIFRATLIFTCAIGWTLASTVSAESALELLSGFDRERISGCYPIASQDDAGEMAKLLYRLRKADEATIDSLAADPTNDLSDYDSAGDVVQISGQIEAIRQYKVPESLIEFLDLEAFQEIVFLDVESQTKVSVFAPPLTGRLSKGDSVNANAVFLGSTESAGDDGNGPSRVYAAGRVAWIPQHAQHVGWNLLAEQGVDLSRVASAASRNRRILLAADSEAFYSMIAAAKQLAEQSASGDPPLPPPVDVLPVSLLKQPEDYHGEWIRIQATTVRVTRISVTDPVRRDQLGQDHYFQIDASGDLGKTVVQLERGEGDEGEPIRMSGSYPVSLVSAVLPSFLEQQMDDQNAVVAMISHPVSIDGFFYRLWSYKNEFMSREGGGRQVGPLIVVSRWKSIEQPGVGEDGVAVIGYLLAIFIFSAIIATFFWARHNAKQDAEIRNRSREATIEV